MSLNSRSSKSNSEVIFRNNVKGVSIRYLIIIEEIAKMYCSKRKESRLVLDLLKSNYWKFWFWFNIANRKPFFFQMVFGQQELCMIFEAFPEKLKQVHVICRCVYLIFWTTVSPRLFQLVRLSFKKQSLCVYMGWGELERLMHLYFLFIIMHQEDKSLRDS